MLKYAAITAFLGTVKNRFMTYHDDRTLEEKFDQASKIDRLEGLELCYPADFSDKTMTKKLLSDSGLGVSAINFRSRRTGKWWRGSFSSAIAAEREEATEDLMRAMDLSEEMGCSRITTCPLNEGTDYLFEADYFEAYRGFEECIARAAQHNPRVKISLEFKVSDPRGRALLGNTGETLAFCQSVGEPNVGVTLDLGHSLYAGERPSQSAVMLFRADRLFYVHLNDNDKFWDWDMVPGAFNLWDSVEFLYYLNKIGYDDYTAFDIFSKEEKTVDVFNSAFKCTDKLIEISRRIDEKKVQALLKERKPSRSMEYLISLL